MKCSKDTNNKNTQKENAVLWLDGRIVVQYSSVSGHRDQSNDNSEVEAIFSEYVFASVPS